MTDSVRYVDPTLQMWRSPKVKLAVGLVTFSANHNHSLGRPNITREVQRNSVSHTARPAGEEFRDIVL